MSAWETVKSLLSWGRVKGAESGGEGVVELAADATGSESREHVEFHALPGFYSVHEDTDAVLTLRMDDGGVTVAAQTERPTDAVAGEKGFTKVGKTGDVLVRITKKKDPSGAGDHDTVEIKGATYIYLGDYDGTGLLLSVVRNGDTVNRTGPVGTANTMAYWMNQVEVFCNAIVPGSITPLATDKIATAVASGTKVYARG